MTLSPEVAGILRAALNEAHQIADRSPHMAYQVLDEARAYQVLAEAVGNLLEPLPEGSDGGQPADLFAPSLASGDEKDLPW